MPLAFKHAERWRINDRIKISKLKPGTAEVCPLHLGFQ